MAKTKRQKRIENRPGRPESPNNPQKGKNVGKDTSFRQNNKKKK